MCISKLTINQLTRKSLVKKDVNWSDRTLLPEEVNLRTTGSIDLYSLYRIPPTFNPETGGNLILNCIEEVHEGFHAKVKGTLWLNKLKTLPRNFSLQVGEGLILRSLKEFPAGYNPTLNGALDLSSVKTLPKHFSPNVEVLYLERLEEIPEGFAPVVRESMHLNSITSLKPAQSLPDCDIFMESLPNGRYHIASGRYIAVDGRLFKILEERGSVIRSTDIKCDLYIVTDEEGNACCGWTLEKAEENLEYLQAKLAGKEALRGIDVNEQLPRHRAVIVFSLIAGYNHTVTDSIFNKFDTLKDTYSLAEVRALAKEHTVIGPFEDFYFSEEKNLTSEEAETLRAFAFENRINIEQARGEKTIDYTLTVVSKNGKIPTGFNPHVRGSLNLNAITEIPENFQPVVENDLHMDNVCEVPDGFAPKVHGALLMANALRLPVGFAPYVSGGLFLTNLRRLPKGFLPQVQGDLHLNLLEELPENFNLTVRGNLYLDNLEVLPKKFHPSVSGSIWLNKATRIEEPYTYPNSDNVPSFIVGKNLCMPSLTYVPETFRPEVLGNLCMDGLTELPETFPVRVHGTLSINGITAINHPFKINLKGSLLMNGVKTIRAEFFPQVSGILEMNSLKSIDSFFQARVGSHLYIHSATQISEKATLPNHRIYANSLPEGTYPTANGTYICKNGELEQIQDR